MVSSSTVLSWNLKVIGAFQPFSEPERKESNFSLDLL